MREVEIGKKGKALLVKEFGEFHAIGHKCSHFGAPLIKGKSNSHAGGIGNLIPWKFRNLEGIFCFLEGIMRENWSFLKQK